MPYRRKKKPVADEAENEDASEDIWADRDEDKPKKKIAVRDIDADDREIRQPKKEEAEEEEEIEDVWADRDDDLPRKKSVTISEPDQEEEEEDPWAGRDDDMPKKKPAPEPEKDEEDTDDIFANRDDDMPRKKSEPEVEMEKGEESAREPEEEVDDIWEIMRTTCQRRKVQPLKKRKLKRPNPTKRQKKLKRWMTKKMQTISLLAAATIRSITHPPSIY